MYNIAEVLEEELENAVQVRDKKSLRRYIFLLVDNTVRKEDSKKIEENILEMKSDIRILAETMKQGFESIDKRFESVDKRFESVDKRFESIDKRFEDLIHHMDKRFEQVDKRFEQVDKRFNLLTWSMGIGFTVITSFLVVILNFVLK